MAARDRPVRDRLALAGPVLARLVRDGAAAIHGRAAVRDRSALDEMVRLVRSPRTAVCRQVAPPARVTAGVRGQGAIAPENRDRVALLARPALDRSSVPIGRGARPRPTDRHRASWSCPGNASREQAAVRPVTGVAARDFHLPRATHPRRLRGHGARAAGRESPKGCIGARREGSTRTRRRVASERAEAGHRCAGSAPPGRGASGSYGRPASTFAQGSRPGSPVRNDRSGSPRRACSIRSCGHQARPSCRASHRRR